MKTQKRSFRWIIVGLLAVVFALPVTFAQDFNNASMRNDGKHQKHKMQNNGKSMGEHRSSIPDLSDKQKEQIKGFKLEMRTKMLQLKNQLREKDARLKTLTTQKNVDMKTVNTVIEDIGALKVKMHKNKVVNQQKIRSILTDNQRLAFDMHATSKGKHHRKMKMHHKGK